MNNDACGAEGVFSEALHKPNQWTKWGLRRQFATDAYTFQHLVEIYSKNQYNYRLALVDVDVMFTPISVMYTRENTQWYATPRASVNLNRHGDFFRPTPARDVYLLSELNLDLLDYD